MYSIKLENKPDFLNNDILKDIVDKIHKNKKIKDINSIYFYLADETDNKLIYQLAIECNSAATFIDGVKLCSGCDIILKSAVFDKKDNFKPCLYW